MTRDLSAAEARRMALAERLIDYFQLQLRFARHLAEAKALPIGEAVTHYTNFHRRFGLGVVGEAPPSALWEHYLSRLSRLGSISEQAAWTRDIFAQTPEETPPAHQHRFGCFACEAPDLGGGVRIHFYNNDSSDGIGPLDSRKAAARTVELATLFGFVRGAYPTAKTVVGASWLYNLAAYRRLFPAAYGESRAAPIGFVRLTGSSSWGQFLDHRGLVKPDLRQRFFDGFADMDIDAPWRGFPFPALWTAAPIALFYEAYGVRA